MPNVPLFKDKYDTQELIDLIDNAFDEEYLNLNIDKLLGIVNIIDNMYETSTDIIDDDEALELKVEQYNQSVINSAKEKAKKQGTVIEDESKIEGLITVDKIYAIQNHSKGIFTNRDETRKAVRHYFEDEYYVRCMSSIFNEVTPKTADFVRNVARYITTFKTDNHFDRLKEFLKYAKAIKEINENKNYIFARKIADNLFEDIEKTPMVYDMTTEKGLYDYILMTDKRFLIAEIINADLEYKQNLIKNNPKRLYNFTNGMLIDQQMLVLSSELSIVSGLSTSFGTLQTKGVIPTIVQDSDDITEYTNESKVSDFIFETAYINSVYANVANFKADFNVTTYGLDSYRDDNTFTYFGDVDIDTIYNELENFENLEVTNSNATKFQKAVANGAKLLSHYMAAQDGSEFLQAFVSKNLEIGRNAKGTNKLTFQSIYIGNKSLYDYANEYLQTENGEGKDFEKVASSFLVKAVNDPSKIITLVTQKITDNGVVSSAVTIEQDYSQLIDRCKNSHGLWDKFKHLFVKYPEEKMVVKAKKAYEAFERTFTRNEIVNDFCNKYKDEIERINNQITKSLDVNVKNIEIKEINEQKEVAFEKEINASKEIKEKEL